MVIKQEMPADYDSVYHLIEDAFSSVEHTDGNEHELVVSLRNSPSFIPELSLVAKMEGQTVGHILFTKANVYEYPVLALALLSVLPQFQRQGIGLALISEGHRVAKEMGYICSVVLGHEKYYPKAGYIPASTYGIRAPFDVPDQSFMACRLDGKDSALNGIMVYDTAFGISDSREEWTR